ncbi:MAG TPA: HlyC/CorC family transporter [Micropepsaceae bacterium]|nr:HlyC/CorC family transporter [Micropepsaceae bacterium]
MPLDVTLSLIAIFALLVFAAFFAGAETALTAVSKARMYHLANEGSTRAKQVLYLINNRERLIGALLLGNTFVNILSSSLATSIALRFFDEGGVVITALVMTAIILIFGEVLPKTLAIARTDHMALAVAYPVRLFVALLSPVLSTVQFIVWRVLKLFGLKQTAGERVLTAQEEIRGAIDLHHQEGGVEREHRDMLGGILDLADLHVADVMVHRKNMEVLDGGAPAEDIVARVLSSSHTRFPIWRDDPENIVGVLHAKDLLRKLMKHQGNLQDIDIMSLASQPWFVPDTTNLEEQLRAFRDRREHFALVVDEYGVLQGLVTLEDILEEIFGSIGEELDQHMPEGIRPQADGSYNVDGWTPVRDLNRELEWNLPDEEATTVAGLVIHEARVIPEVGQVFSFYGFKFEILRRQRNQIMALRITPPKSEPLDDTG